MFPSSIKREIRKLKFHVVASRVVTAKKCTKKRDARAKLLFCWSKPTAFLLFSLPSLLKLPNKSGKKEPYPPLWVKINHND